MSCFQSNMTLFFILVMGGTIPAQNIDVGYGQSGAMIYWQGNLPQGQQTEIVRSSAQTGEGDKRWDIEKADDVETFLRNAEAIPKVFRGVFSFDGESASWYLDEASGARTVEDIPLNYSPNILFAFGLGIQDSTVVQGVDYHYQIFIDGRPVGDKVALNTTLPGEYDWKPAFYSSTRSEPVIRSRWYIPEDKQEDVYTFIGYRATPTDQNYQRVQGSRSFTFFGDSIIAMFTDTTLLPKPGIYHYVIQPVDRFGKLGPLSEYAQGAKFPPEAEPLMTYFKAIGSADKPEIRLEWRIRNAWRIRTMALYRSRHPRDSFQLVRYVSPKDSVYIDRVGDVMDSYYYYFEMDDIARPDPIKSAVANGLSDYQWPAAVPDSIVAVVDGAHVIIRWKSGGNRDRGYYVMRARGFGEPDQMISDFIHATPGQAYYEWVDTTAAGDPESHYTWAVVSESIGYKRSKLSRTVSARPKIPVFIASPKDLKISRTNDTSYLLTWSDGSIDEDQHLGYHVYQKHEDSVGETRVTGEMLLFDQNWLVLDYITPRDTFIVRSFNIYGDSSAYSVPVALYDPFFYNFGPEHLMGRNLQEGIQVRWNQPLRKNISGYALYRADSDEKMEKIADIKDHTINQWLDTGTVSGKTYYYFITAATQNGIQSKSSEVLSIVRK